MSDFVCDREYDRRLGIRTIGEREWEGHRHYHGYEPTPYRALERLFEAYPFRPGDRVVDFGCGRGRVAFAIHDRFRVAVVGIEAHATTYGEALNNKRAYRRKVRGISPPIQFRHGLAEHYEIEPADNRFYFFNPFSHLVFQKVVGNIVNSVAKAPRTVDVILFYPVPEYGTVLRDFSFQLIEEIRVPYAPDEREKFHIYRYPAALRTANADS